MKQYYIHNGQQEQGPFDIQQLKSKSLKNDTPIWCEGMENWTTVDKVEELKQLFNVKPSPPPLTKTVHEKIQQLKVEQTEEFYSSLVSSTERNAAKKKSLSIPAIVVSVLIVGVIASWIIYKNAEHNTTINSLQDKVGTQDQAILAQQQILTDQQNAEAERQRVNDEITAKNMNFRNNWGSYIKVQNNEPIVDYTLGGISEFNFYITNETDCILDQIDVFVQYVRKNGELAQTRRVSVFNVPAGSSEVGTAPSSINGVKVNCSIEKIVSKKMHFCYPADNGNPKDPHFCK